MTGCADRFPGRWAVLLLLLLFHPAVTAAGLTAEFLFSLEGGLDQPSDVAVDGEGNAYVLDGVNRRVVVFGPEGERRFAFGGGLALPMGIAVEGGRIYVADTGNHRIVVFDRRGRMQRVIPLEGEPAPEPVALVVKEGVLVWADRRNHRLCRHRPGKGAEPFCWGERGEEEGRFRYPFQMAFDRDGYLYAVDVLNSRVQGFRPRGEVFMRIGGFGLGPGRFVRPNGLAFMNGEWLLVGDSHRGTLSVFRNGRFRGRLSGRDGEPLVLGVPVGLATRGERLYVVDAAGDRVVVYRLRVSEDTPSPEMREEKRASRRNCATCHLSWAEGYVPGTGEQEGVPPVAAPRMCYSCHHGVVIDSRRAIGRGEQHPDIHHRRERSPDEQDEIPDAFPLAGDDELYCGSCHTPHGDDPQRPVASDEAAHNPWMRESNREGELCHRCHESRVDDVRERRRPRRGVNHPLGIRFESPPHPAAKGYVTEPRLRKGLPNELARKGLRLGPGRELICQSCHRVHGAVTKTLIPSGEAELCSACHRRHHARGRDEARRKGIHPVNVKLERPVQMGGERVTRITCLTCHTLHDGVPGTPLLKFDHREGELCAFCHEGYDRVANSDHDLRVTAPEHRNRFGRTAEKAGVCGACHTLHRGDGRAPFLYAGEYRPWEGEEPALERDRMCLDCHREKGAADEAVVAHFSHPRRDLVLRSDPEVMPLVGEEGAIEEFGTIACITCHDPHRWSVHEATPSPPVARNRRGDLRSAFLRIESVKESFCITCHGVETLLRYLYFHEETGRSDGVEARKVLNRF